MLTDWAERCPIFMIGFLVSGLGLNVILLNIGATRTTIPNHCPNFVKPPHKKSVTISGFMFKSLNIIEDIYNFK